MRAFLEWLWPPPPSLDAALWGRMPRALVEWLLVTYVAPHNCHTVRLCNKTLRQICTPLYERLREEQLQWALSLPFTTGVIECVEVYELCECIVHIGSGCAVHLAIEWADAEYEIVVDKKIVRRVYPRTAMHPFSVRLAPEYDMIGARRIIKRSSNEIYQRDGSVTKITLCEDCHFLVRQK
jgi:hypothetical protein